MSNVTRDSNDDPASVLLVRMSAAPTAEPAEPKRRTFGKPRREGAIGHGHIEDQSSPQ